MEKQWRQLRTLYLALLLGQLLFAGVVWWVLQQGEPTTGAGSDLLVQVGVVVLLGGCSYLAWTISRRLSTRGAQLPGLEEKLPHYRITVIRRLALVEAANLIAVVAALTTNHFIFLLYFTSGLAIFYLFRPTVEQFAQSYALRREEKARLR